jgi:hypothetical protein
MIRGDRSGAGARIRAVVSFAHESATVTGRELVAGVDGDARMQGSV